MYTKVDDLNHANTIKKYLEKNPKATRMDLYTALRFNYRRLAKLDKIGIITLPAATPRGQRNKRKIDRL